MDAPAQTSPTSTVHTRQPNVIARLQALFPSSPTNSAFPEPSSPRRPPPRGLKIRIVSWNMHDNLPRGDLTELFGRVPPYRQTEGVDFPQFPVEDQHPYHIIVVAGQECPSLMGIPLGLGGLKLLDRERESDRDSSRTKDEGKEAGPHDALGWTGMVENWLCYGARPSLAPSTPQIGSPKRLSTRGLSEEPKGPYQLLIKERLMGLYMAIYIHRDLRPFVRGTSRSVVTTGLIGGRVGNKGGIGISLNLDGTSLLFINAHLAAHEGKVNDRLANLAKIKAELNVETFLHANDPRMMAEDIADKFDYTFLFGDLNFRLDISRLHADWLISRQEYEQALSFDQLLNLMKRGGEFLGWNEAPIKFPPTFKYDVLHTLKFRRRRSKLHRRQSAGERGQPLTEVNEHDEPENDNEDIDDSDQEAEGGEAASLSSSTWNSSHSRPGTEGDDDDYFQPSPFSNAMSSWSSPSSRVSLTLAAHKAKTKWLSMMSPSSPHTPANWFKSKHASFMPSSSSMATTASEGKSMHRHSFDRPRQPRRLSSTKSSGDEREGHYDSSSKQRVPSWCDRVLWKTTIQPPDDEEDDVLDSSIARPRTRVGQLIASALRPLTRARRGSYGSFSSTAVSSTTDGEVSITDHSSPSSPDVEHTAVFSRFVEPQARIIRSQSIENIGSGRKPPTPTRSFSNESSPSSPLQRTNSLSHPPSTPPLGRPRRATLSPDSMPFLPSQNRIVTPSRWRFLPSFLNHMSTQSISSDPSMSESIPPRPPRRGDVVCLDYNTLDDRAMRRLEGRSDHRPVLSSWAVYI